MSLYTKCSKCGENKYTNPRLFASRQKLYPEAKTLDEKNNTILINSKYICKNCRKKAEKVTEAKPKTISKEVEQEVEEVKIVEE